MARFSLLPLLSFFCAVRVDAALSRREWNRLFKSDAMRFPSDEAFSAAHDSLRHAELHAHKDRPRHRYGSYILQLRGCDSVCHRAMASAIGSHRYWTRSAEVVQVASSPQVLRDIAAGPLGTNVVDYFPLHPTLKFENDVTSRIAQCSGTSGGQIKLLMSVIPLPAQELADFMVFLSTLGGEISGSAKHEDRVNLLSISIGCPAAATVLSVLSDRSEVEWVEELGEYVTANRWSRGLCQSGNSDITSIYMANLTGHSQIIGISDTGLDMESCYFKDENVAAPFDTVDYTHRKVVYYDTYIDNLDDEVTGHGTHVCGSAAGKSTQDYGTFAQFNGNAPDAKIAFFDIGFPTANIAIPPDLDNELLQVLYNVGARVFTNSWGLQVVDNNGVYFASRNSYTIQARSVDTFMVRNPDALVFFSAGNFGDQHDGNTVSAPATNKNGVCVGASSNDNDAFKSYFGEDQTSAAFQPSAVAYFSSEGPTQDNRMKPDLMGPGFPLYSVAAHQDCGVKALQGTSMASPTVAGSAVLVRDYFSSGFYPGGRRKASDGFNPSGALLKAMLIHSGVPLNTIVDISGSNDALTAYPSNSQGYGRIRLDNVLNFGKPAEGEFLSLFVRGGARPSDQYYVAFRNLGEEHVYTFKTSPLLVQVPIRVTVAYTDAVPSSSANTADVNYLSLVVTRINDTVEYHPLSAGSSTSTNVLVVDIATPAPNSTYMVVVKCLSALSADQSYAIVMTGELTNSDGLVNKTKEISFSHDETGISSSLMTSIWIVVAACVILVGALFTMHRENVIGDKKELRRKKRNSALYKGV